MPSDQQTARRGDGALVHTFEDSPPGREALRRVLLDRFGPVVEYRPYGFGVELRRPKGQEQAHAAGGVQGCSSRRS
jgi:hypothetical protein